MSKTEQRIFLCAKTRRRLNWRDHTVPYLVNLAHAVRTMIITVLICSLQVDLPKTLERVILPYKAYYWEMRKNIVLLIMSKQLDIASSLITFQSADKQKRNFLALVKSHTTQCSLRKMSCKSTVKFFWISNNNEVLVKRMLYFEFRFTDQYLFNKEHSAIQFLRQLAVADLFRNEPRPEYRHSRRCKRPWCTRTDVVQPFTLPQQPVCVVSRIQLQLLAAAHRCFLIQISLWTERRSRLIQSTTRPERDCHAVF